MALTAYSKYRLLVTRSASGGTGYVTVNEFRGFAAGDGSGTNLLTGGTATASGQYMSQAPGLAFDNTAGTYWESDNASSPGGRWLRYDLASPVVVRNFYLSSTSQPAEVPRDFIFQGSNDGTTWDNLFQVVDWVTSGVAKTASFRLDLSVEGVSMLDSGVGASRVLLHNYLTGAFIGAAIPNPTTGAWQARLQAPDDLLVTHLGPSGFRPISDGPVTPYMQ